MAKKVFNSENVIIHLTKANSAKAKKKKSKKPIEHQDLN